VRAPRSWRGWIVATRMKGMAAEQSSDGEPTAAQGAVLLQTSYRVPGTGGFEPTHRPEEPRKGHLIDADQKNEKLGEHQFDTWRSTRLALFIDRSRDFPGLSGHAQRIYHDGPESASFARGSPEGLAACPVAARLLRPGLDEPRHAAPLLDYLGAIHTG
jgi:hypothetical protein